MSTGRRSVDITPPVAAPQPATAAELATLRSQALYDLDAPSLALLDRLIAEHKAAAPVREALERLTVAVETEWELPEHPRSQLDGHKATVARRELNISVEQARAALAPEQEK